VRPIILPTVIDSEPCAAPVGPLGRLACGATLRGVCRRSARLNGLGALGRLAACFALAEPPTAARPVCGQRQGKASDAFELPFDLDL